MKRVPLLLKSPEDVNQNQLRSIETVTEREDALSLVFKFSKNASYEIQYNQEDSQLILYLYNISKRSFKRLLKMEKNYFDKILLSYSKDNIYRIIFRLKENIIPLPYASRGRTNPLKISFSSAHQKKETLKKVPRVELNFSPTLSHLSKNYQQSTPPRTARYQTDVRVIDFRQEAIEPGIQNFQFQTAHPTNDAYGFKINRSHLDERFTIALGKEQLLGVDTLSQISKTNRALLGINGSYFMSNGDPIGLLIRDFRLLSSPVLLRSCFGILDNGKAFIGRPEFQGEIVTEHGILKLEGLNQVSNSNATLLFTPEFGLKTNDFKNTIQLSIKNNEIVKISEDAMTIPQDGFIIRVSPIRFPWISKLRTFSRVVLSYGLTPPWTRMKHGIGGGPRLLEAGSFTLDDKEHFKDKFLTTRAPRSAVGIDELGNVIFLVVDGRRESSPGLTVQELAEVMKRIGSYHALNLDGGGSSTLYLDGKILNVPSDGNERKLSNALLVLKR